MTMSNEIQVDNSNSHLTPPQSPQPFTNNDTDQQQHSKTELIAIGLTQPQLAVDISTNPNIDNTNNTSIINSIKMEPQSPLNEPNNLDILNDGIDATDDEYDTDIDQNEKQVNNLIQSIHDILQPPILPNKPQIIPNNYNCVHNQSYNVKQLRSSPIYKYNNNDNFYYKLLNINRNTFSKPDTFHPLNDNEIKELLQNIWKEHGIMPQLSNPLYNDFIRRNHRIILEELYCDTLDFQNAMIKCYNKYRNTNCTFNLKIKQINAKSSIFMVRFTDKYKHNRKQNNISCLINGAKDHITLVCKCVFKSKQSSISSIAHIINNDKWMISGDYLNTDKHNKYLVIKIKSLYHIFNDDTPKWIQNEYLAHIKNCEWLKSVSYPLMLYKWQMEHCKIFIKGCLSKTNSGSGSLSIIQSTIVHDALVDDIVLNQKHYKEIYDKLQILNQFRTNWYKPNKSQYDAIIKSILLPISLIHGPPGTGKTSTCGNLVNFLLKLQSITNINYVANGKIFVCAYTHNAVNELLTKIIALCPEVTYKGKIVRLGDRDKVPSSLHVYCFKEDTKKEKITARLSSAKVVVGTVYSVEKYRQYCGDTVNYIIIDECTQILHPVLNMPINLLTNKSSKQHLILIGDHKQLPPVIKSNNLKNYKGLFESLLPCNNQLNNVNINNIYSLLNIQYRMCKQLISFCNKYFYDNCIESFQQNIDMNDTSLLDIYGLVTSITANNNNNNNNFKFYHCAQIPIFVISLSNSSMARDGTSWKNETESTFLCRHIIEPFYKSDKYSDLRQSISIGVISFYRGQSKCIYKYAKQLIDKEYADNILISTVDAFQGKEKDLIILSLTRNVITDGNQFNCDLKRINVALSRCKKALIIITSFNTERNYNDSIWSKWFNDFHNKRF